MKIGLSQLIPWVPGMACLREMSMWLLMIRKYFGVQSMIQKYFGVQSHYQCHGIFAIRRKVKDHLFVKILIPSDSSLCL